MSYAEHPLGRVSQVVRQVRAALAQGGPASLLPRPRSIRARLTVWLAMLLVVCMAAFALFLYVAVATTLTNSLDRTLNIQAQQVASTYDFGTAEGADGSDQAGQHVDIGAIDQFATAGVFIETFDAHGHLLARSQNLGQLHLPDEARAATLIHEAPQLSTRPVPGGSLRVYSLPAKHGETAVGLVLVAASLREVTATTQALLGLLAAGACGVALLAVLGGNALVRRGMQPLDEMAAVAERVTVRHLDQRLELGNPPVEVERLAGTFNAMLDRLHEAFADQQRFIADASHELRTPVATLHGRSEVLLLNASLDTETRAGLLMMRDEAARMGRMVANLLLMARGDEARVIARRPVELDTLLLQVAQQAHTLARGRVTVTLNCHDPAEVLGDADLLKQALLNLVDNALTHTPSGGHIKLSLAVAADQVLIAVRDSGCGIPAQHLPHLFERFYRVDYARSRPRGGAGLGLSIVKWIAERHGGTVTVRSAVGRGSVFTIRLPLAAPR